MFSFEQKNKNKVKDRTKMDEFRDIKARLLEKVNLYHQDIKDIKQNLIKGDITENWNNGVSHEGKEYSYRLLCNASEFINGDMKKIICIDNLCDKGVVFTNNHYKHAKVELFLTKGKLKIKREIKAGSDKYSDVIFKSSNNNQPLSIENNINFTLRALEESVFVIKLILD